MAFKHLIVPLAMGLSLAWATSGAAHMVREEEGEEVAPTGKGWGEHRGPEHPRGAAPRLQSRGAGINYHGGPLLISGPTVHLIWYGTWSDSAKKIITDMLDGMGGSPYFNINTSYYNASNVHVRNAVVRWPDSVDSYSHGKSLSDADIKAIVAAHNPSDTNGVYFVLTSADVNETSGFCTQYCGWHDHFSFNGHDIKYAFCGNPARCLSACSMWTTPGWQPPNGDPGADGIVSIIAHELVEATTDPDLNAWYDTRGYENADKCAWTFGATATNGLGVYNVTLAGRQLLIQRNWVNAGNGSCSMHYP